MEAIPMNKDLEEAKGETPWINELFGILTSSKETDDQPLNNYIKFPASWRWSDWDWVEIPFPDQMFENMS